MGLLSLLQSVPHGFVLRAASYLLAFALGLGLGNYHATQRALRDQATLLTKLAADREAALAEGYATAQADYAARVAEVQRREAEAARVAHQTYQAGIVAAAKARQAALAALDKERTDKHKAMETADGLARVNEILANQKPSAPGCVLSAGVRTAINDYIAASNRDLAARAAEAGVAGVLDGAPRPDPIPISCDDVARGITALVEHDAGSMLRALADEVWATKALGPP